MIWYSLDLQFCKAFLISFLINVHPPNTSPKMRVLLHGLGLSASLLYGKISSYMVLKKMC